MINYPIFQECYNIYENPDNTISEFVNAINFKQTIILDPNYYNVILHSCSIKQKYLDIINQLSEGKEIKFYEIEEDITLKCV